jgi:hypothetical protein
VTGDGIKYGADALWSRIEQFVTKKDKSSSLWSIMVEEVDDQLCEPHLSFEPSIDVRTDGLATGDNFLWGTTSKGCSKLKQIHN